MADTIKILREKKIPRLSKIEHHSLNYITNHKRGRDSTLLSELKDELSNFILEMKKSEFGLTCRDIRSFGLPASGKK